MKRSKPKPRHEGYNQRTPRGRPGDLGDWAIFGRDGRHRFALGRRWGSGPTLGWVMLNPSVAGADSDDPTIRRVVGFSRSWGAGSAVVVNVFSQVATKPADLERIAIASVLAVEEGAEDYDSAPELVQTAVDNRRMVSDELSRCDAVVLAWGGNVERHGQLWVARTCRHQLGSGASTRPWVDQAGPPAAPALSGEVYAVRDRAPGGVAGAGG